ncbi:MAG: alpha/beta fold hydrolase [Leptospira sp.]|nr:alpha/beta fold hydrolase [Leptospira sp.]
MKLFFRKIEGNGRPIVVLHGLFGSSKNWLSVGKVLSQFGPVYLLDARNHGESPHSETHTLNDMALDLKEFIADHLTEKPVILGHSMGGLTTIYFSLLNPGIPAAIVIVDVAPKKYEMNYTQEFDALQIDVSGYNSRQEIDRDMTVILPDTFIRQFLQMNLEKTGTGYKWKLNVEALKNSSRALAPELEDEMKFLAKALFIIGENAGYVSGQDKVLITKHFPNAEIITIKNADHYLQYTHFEEFIKITSDFLKSI